MATQINPPQPVLPVSIDDVRVAHDRIRASIVRTPTLISRTLSEMTGATVYLKFENLQFTAAYKERGALNTLLQLSDEARAKGVIAAPRLGGPWLDHLPCDRDGFLPADTYGRLAGLSDVYAAGDCTPFPVRHPSLAAQQADAVAGTIAAEAGCAAAPEPFTPVLRGVLPSRLRWYVDAPLTGGHGDATKVSAIPLWRPPLRFHARFLGPHLGAHALSERVPQALAAPA